MSPHKHAAFALWLVLLTACAPLPKVVVEPASPPPQHSPAPPTATSQRTPAVVEMLAMADEAANRAPRAMKLIRTEGRLPTDPIAQASHAAKADWYAMYMLALAAQSDTTRYGPELERYFAAWVTTFQPQFNPISESHFHWVAMAYDISHQQLSPSTAASGAKLLRQMAEAALHPPRDAGASLTNNWQSHRIKLAATMAFALDDADLIARSREAFQKQLGDNIGGDGVVNDFRHRDALHYVTYSLEPLLTAALMAQRHGEDWYGLQGRNGASLEKALKWLAPFAGGEKTHEEFRRSTVAFDHKRAAAGVPGFSGLWNPQGALFSYHIAARLRAGWIPLAIWLGPQPTWLELGFPSPAVTAAQAELERSRQMTR